MTADLGSPAFSLFFVELLVMSNIWDCFTPIRDLFSGLDGDPRPAPQRRTVRLQLEQLEKREVPAVGLSVQPPNPAQVAQQLLNSSAQTLEQVLSEVVVALPFISSALNSLSMGLSARFGPQQGQQFTSVVVRGVESVILGLENATLNALHAEGVFFDPTFNADAAFINAFLFNPLHFVPPA